MAKKKAGAVLDPPQVEIVSETSAKRYESRSFEEIAVALIDPDPAQPRRFFDPGELYDLECSLKENGQLEPIAVYPKADGRYQLIWGERRWRAARNAKWTTIRAQIFAGDLDRAAIRIGQLTENLNRSQLEVMEEARAFMSVAAELKLSYVDLAGRLGVTPARITRAVALTKLPRTVQAFVESGELAPSSGYEISKLKSEQAASELALRAVDEGWSRDRIAVEVDRLKTKAGEPTTREAVEPGRIEPAREPDRHRTAPVDTSLNGIDRDVERVRREYTEPDPKHDQVETAESFEVDVLDDGSVISTTRTYESSPDGSDVYVRHPADGEIAPRKEWNLGKGYRVVVGVNRPTCPGFVRVATPRVSLLIGWPDDSPPKGYRDFVDALGEALGVYINTCGDGAGFEQWDEVNVLGQEGGPMTGRLLSREVKVQLDDNWLVQPVLDEDEVIVVPSRSLMR